MQVIDKKVWSKTDPKIPTFPVFLGDNVTPPHIIPTDDPMGLRDSSPDLVVDVPIEYRHHFETAIEDAMKNLCGISISTSE